MKAIWIKPNLKGILLYLAVLLCLSHLFTALNFMPSPTFNDGKQSVSWPWLWLWIGADVIVILLLYPLCMWFGTRMPRQGAARLLTGPLMIIPQGLIVAIAIGVFIYEPPEMHGHLERHIFLQGNTDWGGGCLFAGTIALYVVFGFTSAWYLMLTLSASDHVRSFWRTTIRAFWILKFHILAFVIGGTAFIADYDVGVTPNDFRNMFLFAGTIYLLSLFLICTLHMSRLSPRLKLAFAPLFTILWLIVGSDGNTQRAGQLVQSGQDPQPIVRGRRHAVMVSWHRLCNRTFGDIKKHK